MGKIEKILVPIDFSEPSFNAFETAACLADKCDATLYLIHVQDNIFDFMGINSLMVNSVSNNSSNVLMALAADVRSKWGIESLIIEESGYPTEAIVKTAVKHKCDLIVMGTYGASGFRNAHIGTTAYSVVKFAPCPVLLMPAGKKWSSFKKPILPVRPVTTAPRHYEIIRNLLEDNSALSVLGMYHSERDRTDDLDEIVSDIQRKLILNRITASAIWSAENSISRNILRQAEKLNADLIIVTPAVDISPKTFYIGPNTHDIIHSGKIPTLIINKVNAYALANHG
jgi:nucleotide-binding universal stress UspA family protein